MRNACLPACHAGCARLPGTRAAERIHQTTHPLQAMNETDCAAAVANGGACTWDPTSQDCRANYTTNMTLAEVGGRAPGRLGVAKLRVSSALFFGTPTVDPQQGSNLN